MVSFSAKSTARLAWQLEKKFRVRHENARRWRIGIPAIMLGRNGCVWHEGYRPYFCRIWLIA
jgi:hypothetical protein